MPQIAFTGGQATADLAQRLRSSRVAGTAWPRTVPTTESAGMALGPVLDHGPLKLVAGKQLQHLAGNAGYSYHGGGVLPLRIRLLNANRSRVLPRRSKLILDSDFMCRWRTTGHENGFPQPGS
jgi:hypothetical protein